MDNNEKTKEKIVVVKLYNGEFVIGKEVSSLGERIMLKDPRNLTLVPSMTGSINIAITSVSMPFKSTRLDDMMLINCSQIMFALNEDEIDKEVINGYKSKISGIKIASIDDIASLNSSSNFS